MISDLSVCSVYILLLLLFLVGFTRPLPASFAIQSTAAIYSPPNLLTSSPTGECFYKVKMFRSRQEPIRPAPEYHESSERTKV